MTASGQTPVLKTAFFDSSPRFIKNADASWSGFSTELMHLIEKKSGFIFQHPNNFVPLKRIELDLTSGKIDFILGLSKTPTREKELVFAEPLYTIDSVIIARADDPIRLTSLDDLKKIASESPVLSYPGNYLTDYAKNQLQLPLDDGAPSVTANLDKLLAGRGRVFLAASFIAYEITNSSKYKNKLKILPLVIKKDQQWFCFSKNVPQDQIRKISAAIRTLKKEKEWEAILSKYFLYK